LNIYIYIFFCIFFLFNGFFPLCDLVGGVFGEVGEVPTIFVSFYDDQTLVAERSAVFGYVGEQ